MTLGHPFVADFPVTSSIVTHLKARQSAGPFRFNPTTPKMFTPSLAHRPEHEHPEIPAVGGHQSEPLYHYTTGDRFHGIVTAGEIRPAFQNVMPPEIPAVWLSCDPSWELTATKGVIVHGRRREATLDELVRLCGCLVRVQVDPRKVVLIGYNRLREDLRIPRQTFARLLTAGRAMGSRPHQWSAVATPVPASAFLSIEFAYETSPPRWLCL